MSALGGKRTRGRDCKLGPVVRYGGDYPFPQELIRCVDKSLQMARQQGARRNGARVSWAYTKPAFIVPQQDARIDQRVDLPASCFTVQARRFSDARDVAFSENVGGQGALNVSDRRFYFGSSDLLHRHR